MHPIFYVILFTVLASVAFSSDIGMKGVVIFLLLWVIGCTTTKSLIKTPHISYSEGERHGIIRKLSKKGMIFKTYEGELMMNASYGSTKLDTFNFSVSSDSLVTELMKVIGKDIVITYEQFKFVPWSVGDSQYIIKSFKLREDG